MASKFEVNTSTLRSDVEEIGIRIKDIQKSAETLERILVQLEQMWEGQAKAAFSAAVRDDLRGLRDLAGAMQDLTERTGVSREEYDKCEKTVSDIIASIRI